MLTQDELAMLQAIRASGSLSRAAAQLGKAPSTISHAARQLETRYDALLFDRRRYRLELTPAGKLLASSPCGQLTSYYRSNSAKHRISIRKPRADGKVCAKTDAAYAEFKQLKKALKNSQTYQITGERLELRDKKGALQISANAAR